MKNIYTFLNIWNTYEYCHCFRTATGTNFCALSESFLRLSPYMSETLLPPPSATQFNPKHLGNKFIGNVGNTAYCSVNWLQKSVHTSYTQSFPSVLVFPTHSTEVWESTYSVTASDNFILLSVSSLFP